MSEAKKWTKVGEILKSKKGDLYVKIKASVSLNSGDALQIRDPRKSIASAVERGTITEAEGEKRLASVQEFHRYDLILPPPNEAEA
jgi:hypothetical protein